MKNKRTKVTAQPGSPVEPVVPRSFPGPAEPKWWRPQESHLRKASKMIHVQTKAGTPKNGGDILVRQRKNEKQKKKTNKKKALGAHELLSAWWLLLLVRATNSSQWFLEFQTKEQ